ncbi:unnamed protein product [Musa hybrid cultivar]
MATSSSPSATERARFFFATTLLPVMLVAAPKPRRGRAPGPWDPAIQLPSGRPDPETGGGRRQVRRCSWLALLATGTTGTRYAMRISCC